MSIQVNDPAIKSSLLIHLIEQIERGQFNNLLSTEDPEALDILRSLNMASICRLTSMGYPKIQFSIDYADIGHGLSIMNRQDEENEDLVYFIEHGATLSMLNEFFTDQETIKTYRKILTSKPKVGRSLLPDEATRDKIHECWHKLSKTHPHCKTQRSQIRAMHLMFSHLSIDTVYAAINEFTNS